MKAKQMVSEEAHNKRDERQKRMGVSNTSMWSDKPEKGTIPQTGPRGPAWESGQ